MVVGDGEGTVGYGLGKARDVQEAVAKGIEDAKRNIVKVTLRNGTVPHDIKGKFGAGKVLIRAASPGTGVIAGGAMRAVLEAAGVHNCLAKSMGSSNPHNVIKATIEALKELRDANTIARQRGISLDQVFDKPMRHKEVVAVVATPVTAPAEVAKAPVAVAAPVAEVKEAEVMPAVKATFAEVQSAPIAVVPTPVVEAETIAEAVVETPIVEATPEAPAAEAHPTEEV